MALVTYDVSGKQIEVKQKMVERGYHDRWESNGQTYHLPNTTLWKQDAEVATARADIQLAAQAVGVKLLRAVAVPTAPWSAIPGEPHTS
ncbi:hypothetical protein [Anaeromyxobacter sp. SG17]|uniref:hypothetical protein n=1 Tax=Anaeromyxobacter sp. SG17 TaxID=2925405 RepID=UPI001F5632E3|nr:hypothetical protein [Anaeromyxobacter sp. SG17]